MIIKDTYQEVFLLEVDEDIHKGEVWLLEGLFRMRYTGRVKGTNRWWWGTKDLARAKIS